MYFPSEEELLSLDGVIFDLDGTLVASHLDFAAIRNAVGCPEGIGVLEYIEALPASRRTDALKVVEQAERQGAERATWMPGADALLASLRNRATPTAIFTRNSRQMAELTMARLGIRVDRLLAREDGPPKPAPDGLLAIASRWGSAPARLTYIGDFIYDLQAARAAGMIASYYDPHRSGRFRDYADWIIEDFAFSQPCGNNAVS